MQYAMIIIDIMLAPHQVSPPSSAPGFFSSSTNVHERDLFLEGGSAVKAWRPSAESSSKPSMIVLMSISDMHFHSA